MNHNVQDIKLRYSVVGSAEALNYAIDRALTVAPYDQSVLILGESGVGKEVFPRIIHDNGPRKHKKYIAVNCGAIPEGTIDSELFGHEKGSFTGAIGDRKGYFEEADGGTIFLDEVAELPMTTQARLLRVLENGEFIKVGSSTVQRTNVRVVAATNVDMLRAIQERKFREDLYYRLSTVIIHIPPLRERGADVLLLARKFARDFAQRYRTPEISLEEQAKDALRAYRWPGNVRQLKNVIEQVALFHAGEKVSAQQIAEHLPHYDEASMKPAAVADGAAQFSYDRERELIFRLLTHLQSEIDTLREQLEQGPQAAPAASSRGHLLPEFSQRSFDDNRPEPALPVIDLEQHHAEEEPKSLEDTERESIRQALHRNGGRRKATAEELKISERTLYRKIKEYGLDQ